MRTNGETHAAMVFNLAKDGKSAENNTHGAIAGNNCGYEGVSALVYFKVIERDC